jgi:hypothetical protein
VLEYYPTLSFVLLLIMSKSGFVIKLCTLVIIIAMKRFWLHDVLYCIYCGVMMEYADYLALDKE